MSSHLYQPVAAYIFCSMECLLTALITISRTNCCLCVLVISGEGDVHADEEPEDKEERKVISVSESVGVAQIGQGNEHPCGWILLQCK